MREAAHRFALLQRNQLIDTGYDPVPVAAQIECDNGRNDQKRKDRNQRLPFRPQRSQKTGHISHRLIHDVAGGSTGEIVADDAFEPRIVRVAHQRLQTLRVSRRIVDEGRQLPHQRRRNQEKQQHEGEREAGQDDERSKRPAHAALGQPSVEGIEQVGDRHAENERQQNGAQQPQQADENGERGAPEHDVALDLHCAPFKRVLEAISDRRRTSSCGGSTPRDRRRSKARSRPRPAPW